MRISDWSSDVCSSDLPRRSWMKRASLRRVMVMTRHSEIAEAQARAALARQELNGSVNALVSRIKPSGLAHQAFSGARKAGWVSVAFRVYRYRATALTVLGLIANLTARKKRNAGWPGA